MEVMVTTGAISRAKVVVKVNVKVHRAYTWNSASSWNITSEALRYGTCSQGISQFYLHTHMFIRSQNESYLPLPSQL